MKKLNYFGLLLLATAMLFSCEDNTPTDPENEPEVEAEDPELVVTQLDREPFYTSNPLSSEVSQFTVTHEAQKLEFFGWGGMTSDAEINMTFPENTEYYNRAILTYRMGGYNEGPSAWDHTTLIMVYDKSTEDYYEIARAFTPYGASFGSTWSKYYYMDVTEFLPMLTGDCEFRVWYSGFDATETRSHTVKMTFDFYAEAAILPRTVFTEKIYDSRYNHNGYRCWRYGQEATPIEADSVMGVREFTVPEDVESLLLRVSITGHGQEQGVFPNRDGYSTRNAAEFDYNYYDVIVNGTSYGQGYIFWENGDNYYQAGNYLGDRANWGPGWPANVQYWKIDGIPNDRKITIDFDLEEYIGLDYINDYTACYLVQVDAFGLDSSE